MGGNPIHGDPGCQIPIFWPKMTPNIGIIQITSLFGPFDNAKLPQIYIQDKTWWCFFKNNCKTMGVTLYRGTPGGQTPKFWEKMVCRNDVTRKIGVSWRIFWYWWNLTPRNKPVKVFYFLKMDLRTDSSAVWQLILNHMSCFVLNVFFTIVLTLASPTSKNTYINPKGGRFGPTNIFAIF